MNWNEDNIEEFIKANKEKFNIEPHPFHKISFLKKLRKLVHGTIKSIVPYLVKVSIAVVVVWGLSIAAWWIFKVPTIWDLFIKLISK